MGLRKHEFDQMKDLSIRGEGIWLKCEKVTDRAESHRKTNTRGSENVCSRQ